MEVDWRQVPTCKARDAKGCLQALGPRREAGRGFSSKPPQGTNPPDVLVSSFCPHELIENKFCFKPLSVWSFVMATLEDQYKRL